MKQLLAKIVAQYIVYRNRQWANNPKKAQQKTLKKLLKKGRDTDFGKNHSFAKIATYDAFKQYVPVRDYEGLRPYIEKIIAGKENVLVRIHDQCFTSEVLGSLRCDCKEQLEGSMRLIKEDEGVLIYLQQEGRGIGLSNKIGKSSQ